MPRAPDTDKHLKLLQLIDEGHGKSGSARILKVSPTAVSKQINRLTKLGYVVIDKQPYPHIVKLTAKGQVALKRQVLTLSRYVPARPSRLRKGESPDKGIIRLHNLQVLIPILKKGRPLPLNRLKGKDGKNDLNNWTQYFLDIQAPIKATVEQLPNKIRLYMYELQTPRGLSGYLSIMPQILQTIVMVHQCVLKFGWVLDLAKIEMPTQHATTTMPELDNLDLQSCRVYLDRKAKDLQDQEMNQEARAEIDRSEKVIDGKKCRTLEIETNDSDYLKKLNTLPQAVGLPESLPFEEGILLVPERIDNINSNMRVLGQFARSHEDFMVTMSTETLPALNALIKKLEERL